MSPQDLSEQSQVIPSRFLEPSRLQAVQLHCSISPRARQSEPGQKNPQTSTPARAIEERMSLPTARFRAALSLLPVFVTNEDQLCNHAEWPFDGCLVSGYFPVGYMRALECSRWLTAHLGQWARRPRPPRLATHAHVSHLKVLLSRTAPIDSPLSRSQVASPTSG